MAQPRNHAATQPRSAWPAFDAKRFESLALGGWQALEFNARALHLCVALEATLPGRHEIDLRINGEVRARAFFELSA
jgi:hypothetical protein